MRRVLMPIVLAVALAASASPVLAESPAPPKAPSDLRVAGTGPTMIRWAWHGGSCDEGFRVAVSTSREMSRPRFRTVSTTWATSTGMTPGRNYFASVRCKIGSTYSAPTNVVVGRAGVVGTPRWTRATTISLDFEWAPYAGATGYQFAFSRFSDADPARRGTVAVPRRRFGGLERDTHYYLKVRALNGSGAAISGWSPIGHAVTNHDPVFQPG